MKKLWYACMVDDEDQDWGTGFYNLAEATEYLKARKDIYPDGYIVVIDITADPVCVDEIKNI